MDSYEGRLANTQLPEDDVERRTNIACFGDIFMRHAKILYGSASEHYRPYLFLSGEVHSIKGDFPDGITELSFPKGLDRDYPKVDYKYNFTNEQLADLAAKGLYDDGFEVPDIFLNNTFEDMPMVCDVCAVKGMEVPIIFVSIKEPFAMETSVDECGYELASEFEVPRQEEFDEYEDYEDGLHDVLFEQPQSEPEQVEEREVTEDERIFRRALHRVEDYSVTKSDKRLKLLAEKEHMRQNVLAEDAEQIREEIKQHSIEVALQKAKEDNDNGLEVQDVVVKDTGAVVYGDETFTDESYSDEDYWDDDEFVSDEFDEDAELLNKSVDELEVALNEDADYEDFMDDDLESSEKLDIEVSTKVEEKEDEKQESVRVAVEDVNEAIAEETHEPKVLPSNIQNLVDEAADEQNIVLDSPDTI